MSTENVVRIMCPNLKCRSVLGVPDHARGKLVRCKKCGTNIMIPKKKTTPPPAPVAATPDSEE
ncbi:MAG: hypothetical protein AAFX05_03145 [Planctomycetota bacterium]